MQERTETNWEHFHNCFIYSKKDIEQDLSRIYKEYLQWWTNTYAVLLQRRAHTLRHTHRCFIKKSPTAREGETSWGSQFGRIPANGRSARPTVTRAGLVSAEAGGTRTRNLQIAASTRSPMRYLLHHGELDSFLSQLDSVPSSNT